VDLDQLLILSKGQVFQCAGRALEVGGCTLSSVKHREIYNAFC